MAMAGVESLSGIGGATRLWKKQPERPENSRAKIPNHQNRKMSSMWVTNIWGRALVAYSQSMWSYVLYQSGNPFGLCADGADHGSDAEYDEDDGHADHAEDAHAADYDGVGVSGGDGRGGDADAGNDDDADGGESDYTGGGDYDGAGIGEDGVGGSADGNTDGNSTYGDTDYGYAADA